MTGSNPTAGASYIFFLRQDGGGSRVVTFSGFVWAGGTPPTLSTDPGAVDVVTGIGGSDGGGGTVIFADIAKAFG